MLVNPMGARFEEYWTANSGAPLKERMPYAIRRLSDGRVVGTSAYVTPSARHGSVEIGGTFLSPDVRAGAVNPESKILMLGHAFESGAIRVQFKIDSRNDGLINSCPLFSYGVDNLHHVARSTRDDPHTINALPCHLRLNLNWQS